jgi:ATP-dependent Lon protease
MPLNVGQPRSIELINDVLRGDRSIVVVASRNPEVETPAPEDLYDVGVLGVIQRMIRVPDGTLRVLIQGAQRVRIERWVASEPYLVAEVVEAPDEVQQTPELIALMRNVQQTFSNIVQEVPYLPEELQIMVANLEDPSALTHLIGGALRLKTEEKQACPRCWRASLSWWRSARRSSCRSSPSSTRGSASTSCASSSRRSRRSWARPTRSRPRSTSCASS